MRITSAGQQFLRRSRGYVPEPAVTLLRASECQREQQEQSLFAKDCKQLSPEVWLLERRFLSRVLLHNTRW